MNLSARIEHEGEYVELAARKHTVWAWSLLWGGGLNTLHKNTSIRLETSSEKLEIPTPSVLYTFPGNCFARGTHLRHSEDNRRRVRYTTLYLNHIYTGKHPYMKLQGFTAFGLSGACGWQFKE